MSNPRIDTPEDDPQIHPNPNPSASLVESFGELVDDLRQIATDFGVRPYRVFSVVYKWTGGEVGRGEAVVHRVEELLPTPVVKQNVRGESRSAGVVERGDAYLEQVSPRYTEDQIRTLFPCVKNGQFSEPYQGFVEVTMDARDGKSDRRRYQVIGVPERRAEKFDWRVRLIRQDENRDRDGRPPTPARRP